MNSSDEGDEVGAFGISEDFVESRQHKTAGESKVDFDGLLEKSLKLHEDLKEGCGGQLWPAGIVLSKYLLRRHRNLEGLSMFVARTCASLEYLESDCCPAVSNLVQVVDLSGMLHTLLPHWTPTNLLAQVSQWLWDVRPLRPSTSLTRHQCWH